MIWKDLTEEEVVEFECVKDWLDSVSTRRTGSKGTRRNYIRQLKEYCNYRQMKPDQLLVEGDKTAPRKKRMTMAEYNLIKYFPYLEKESPVKDRKTGEIIRYGLKRGTCKAIYGAIRSFFRSNEILFYDKTPSGGSRARSIELNKARLIECVTAATPHEAYILCGLASTGMRPGDFVALTYEDIQTAYEAGEERLYIEKESEKEDLWYGVFLSRQATKFLRMMLEARQRKGEKITKDSFLIAHEQPGRGFKGTREERERLARSRPISTNQLRNILNRAAERVGLKLTPKLFRKNFRTYASPAIGKEATMKMAAWKLPGVGDSYYLPGREKTLELYLQIEDFFMYEVPTVDVDDARRKAFLDVARIMLRDDHERLVRIQEIMEKESDTDKAIEFAGEIIRREFKGIVIIPKKTKTNGGSCTNDRNCQRIVSEEELPSLLAQGWRVSAVLPSGKVVVESA